MTYIVDFVINVMEKISSKKPVMFQRDGSLYVASHEGFGQVTHGLHTRPEKIESWESREQPAEITASENMILKFDDDNQGEKNRFKEGEEKFLEAISFGPDTDRFTLEEMTNTVEKLTKLPDDGKIRMIGHDSGYHSHKYGYAADGIDVWLAEARVMNKDMYLDLVRKKEDKNIQTMENIKREDMRDLPDIYSRLRIPDCTIITPHLMVSLPRRGILHWHRREPDSWTKHTAFASQNGSNGSILNYREADTYQESPYAVNITLNSHDLRAENEANLKSVSDALIEKITEQLSAINFYMPLAEESISRINAVHNTICEKNIAWRKDRHKK